MSATPRTDAAYFKQGATMYDLAGESKKLERELAAAKEECDLNRNRLASIFWSDAMDNYTGGDVQKWAAEYTAELARLRARDEQLTNLWRDFIRLLEIVEETDDGVEFRPNSIQSCRALDGMQMQGIIERAKASYMEH